MERALRISSWYRAAVLVLDPLSPALDTAGDGGCVAASIPVIVRKVNMLRGTSGYAAVDELSNGQLVEVGEDTWLALDAEKLGTEPNHSERTGEPMGGGLGGRDSESDGHNESFIAKPRREEGAGGGGARQQILLSIT